MAKAILNGNEIFGNVHMGEGGDVANPNIADVYDPTQTYNTGDRRIYDDVLYVCNDDNVTGAWDSTKWDSATIDEIISALTASDIPYSAGVSVADKLDNVEYQVGDTIDITGFNISGFSFGSGVFGFLNLSKPISNNVTSITINGHVQVFDENANAYINSNISQAGTSRQYTITKAGIVINFSFSPSITNKGANLWWFDTTTTVTFN